ncbi:MAG TPA: bifunctional phosphoribosylaminoimidazolecarboxamide formyltransferase/IMP cyclohydrolase [Thermoplasmata archaeon]|nr:bifunctional phosphoribosylaminoimidazolecarboxamide formyltransferase/IMP cyclohydrolase [Thermoplasmata archaeon]
MEADLGSVRRVERAILSVEDKAGLAPFATGLASLGVELWATGGTRRALENAGCAARSVEELTGVDAWFGGRVKTLHPAVFGGILAPRTTEGLEEVSRRALRTFDLVVVNLYPFERHLAANPNAADREEFIDIGGVSLVRAAAKNHAAVAVASDPSQYPGILTELRVRQGGLSAATRRRLAVEAFGRCSRYDAAIAAGLGGAPGPEGFPSEVVFRSDPLSLRYGENPHQRAHAYAFGGPAPFDEPAMPFEVLKGSSPSYTNLLDLETAVGLVEEFAEPAACVVKHATPCGAATATTVQEALAEAIATDPVARYGCAVAVNRPFGAEALPALHGVFVDLLVAPEFAPEALEALGRRPKIKLVRAPIHHPSLRRWDARTALGRLLVQETDRRPLALRELRHVTGPELEPADLASLAFAWSVVRHARSNGIALARGSATVGIGSGQPTRVKAVELACGVAGDRARGAVLASDAFFPFADGIEVAARAGVRAVVQPGGSLRDPDVVAVAQRSGMSMYFTGWRVFRH